MLKFHTIPAGMVICPMCAGALRLQGNSLICGSRHCFDIAKQGYVNFLLQALKEKYDKRLFQSRARISQAGAFHGLTDRLGEIVRQELERQERRRNKQGLQQQGLQQQGLQQQGPQQQGPQQQVLWRQKPEQAKLRLSPEGGKRLFAPAILDAGCGEGSHLSALVRQLAETAGGELVNAGTEGRILAAGIDISKAGIQLAAKTNPEMLWGVADLAKCPFADRSFDIILNILSPANYAEFHRMLADDGLVIKVIPGQTYLQEIRQALHSETNRRTYSNDRTIGLFRRHFELIDMKQVRYEVLLEQEYFADLLQMTPLAWQAAEEELRSLQAMDEKPVITFNFMIMLGKKNIR
ncbi:hypothetical protein YSY43_00110 [Paenibacillus sp. YSY-4.3]